MSGTREREIGIIGGGIIGLSIAWQCARAGMQVTLLEKENVGVGTSSVAAGMLAPEAEVDFGEEALMKLSRRSLGLYPSFLEELKEDALEFVPELDPCGTILVGKDRDDVERLNRLYRFRQELGLRVEWWGGDLAREHCELLSPRVNSAIWLPEDAQIDNRRLLQALKEGAQKQGAVLKEACEVKAYEKDPDGALFRVHTDNATASFDDLVLCAGAWSEGIEGQGGYSSLHPVKGQILTLGRIEGSGLGAMIRSPRAYLVPKADGSLRVGGTSEETGFDLTATAGGVRELLEEAWELVPAVQDAPFHSVEVGLRPAHRDHRPFIGRRGNGALQATGHYRHGFLLAPLTAYSVRDALKGADIPAPFQGMDKEG
ncbi:MAG: glycine oxidase ThiO [Flavobacteriales bacterium]